MKKICCTILSLTAAAVVYAQYPVIPPALQAKSDSLMAIKEAKSDVAWEKALIKIKEDEKQGKPYIPWAAEPKDLPQAKIPAFPGAEGGGAYSFGGRGGKVYVVTNLNDSGEGSLRWACEQGGARIVVFNVAGIIHLKSPITVRAPYITIAGQTAPGDGVCIAGESFLIDTHDVVVRFMRFRRGVTDVTRRDDALGGNGIGNIIIDHVSASWGLDENMSMYRHVYDRDGKNLKLPTVNITIQNSIFSEALDTYNHSFGSTIGGLNSTFMRNLWASNISRSPSVGMYGDFGFVNNVVWNWWNRTADGGDHRSEYNFINNYYKPGPITPIDKPIAYRILKPESGRDKENRNNFGKAYVNGNIVEGFPKITKNNWAGGVQVEGVDNPDAVLAKIKVNKPFKLSAFGKIMTAQQSYDYVLANVGATLPKRDAVDERIVKQVRTGQVFYTEPKEPIQPSPYVKRRLQADSYKQGIIVDVSQVGGYPEYKGTPYKDSDNDGMPDDYEIKKGLNPNDPADASYITKSGYSNIEEYLNSVVPVKGVKPY